MASCSVELSPTALGEWMNLSSREARLAADQALEELTRERHPAGSFQLAGERAWRLVRRLVIVVYLPTESGAFVTGIRDRIRVRGPGDE